MFKSMMGGMTGGGGNKQMQQPMKQPGIGPSGPMGQMQQRMGQMQGPRGGGNFNPQPQQMPPWMQQQEMQRPQIQPMMERPGGIGGSGFQRFNRQSMY
jgi:hypothetical protein